jgi:hypothetical protein
MPDAKLTDAELAEGLRLYEVAKRDLLNGDIQRLEKWSWDHGETALRELAALRAKRATTERELEEAREAMATVFKQVERLHSIISKAEQLIILGTKQTPNAQTQH